MILWLCIIVRITANPFSNVFQKFLTRQRADPLMIIGATHGLLSMAGVPILLWAWEPVSNDFWRYMTFCTVLTVSGNVLIVHAVRRSDLSVLGPINSYKPVVSLLPGILWLNEIPGPRELGGIALIVLGSYFLLDKDTGINGGNFLKRFLGDRGIQYRLAALILSALEAVVLKKALLLSTPLMTFAFWSIFGFGLSALALGLTMRGQMFHMEHRILQRNKLTYFMLFVTTGLMQLCTIVTLRGFPVGSALALFQISTVIAVVLGWRVFQEKHFVKRLSGSLIMVSGAVLIVLGKGADHPTADAIPSVLRNETTV